MDTAPHASSREVAGIEVAHGNNCVALIGKHDGRRWGEVLDPDEADTLAAILHSQADAARHASGVAPASPR